MGESKQVKVDNWGIFFLQRLQTFFNKTYFCDLTLQFEENVQLKVHRLVLNACTEYFQVLEQTCDSVNDCLIMPPDLQADVVVPIVNFMYSGILEFQISTFDRLYATARLMNMTVLTKLLDAQKVPISPIAKPMNKRPAAPITWNLQGKKITPKTMDPDLPEQLPGRKLPIWKRKSAPVTVTPNISSPIEFSRGMLQTVVDPLSNKYFRPQHDEPPKPTRFDWPEDDAYDTAPFDEISYTSRPIKIATTREKSPKPSTSNFDEVKRSSVKRPASPVYDDNKKVNIQDVKEYIKEQKIRSDYNDYDDSETADNDLQTYDDNDSDDDAAQNSEESNKGILKNDTSPPHNKRVRFSIEGKENTKSVPQGKDQETATIKATGDVSNHTKIITEVLKKFPQLVQKNKNIRLKILAKGQNANTISASKGTPVKVVKPVSKVSYMVHKPTDNKTSNDKKDQQYTCQRCSETNPTHFDTYHAYRLHLTEVHNEKTDSQMCNICGHVSRKQNMLMYHKYVKHNIEPPPIFQFPKCTECSYVALSPSLLIKHQYNHTHQNLVCAECHTAFSNKTDLIRHIQTTGHSGSNNPTTYDCTHCPKKFISNETLNQHIRNNHKDTQKEPPKKNIITAEEIDAMDENEIIPTQQQQQTLQQESPDMKPKEKKIKILSDIKVNKPLSTSHLLPVKQQAPTEEKEIESQQLEQPSSEAESLSNVASGIAASLGLVNTIVVLDENNQFILQDGSQAPGSEQNFILPENIQNIVSQHQVITSDSNSIITQAGLAKNSIGSTDELVMVLTDHDYSDATNNAVITSDNSNIVVLYSHPVQGQDGQFISQPGNLMLNSNMGLVEVSNNFGVATNDVAIDKTCDESIEMIQQEINSHLEEEIQNKAANQQENVAVAEVEEHAESQEKMEIEPYEVKPLPELSAPTSQKPLPGIQTIATAQKYMFIPTTTHDNLHEMQNRMPEIQDNMTEMQDHIPEMQESIPQMPENISEMQQNILSIQPAMEENPEMQENLPDIQQTLPEIQENIPEIQENIPEMQENLPEIQSESQENLPQIQENLPEIQENLPEMQENLPAMQENLPEIQENLHEIPEDTPPQNQNQEQETIPKLDLEQKNTNEEVPFEEPMEVEESVEMVQQEINRQQLEREQLKTENPPTEDTPKLDADNTEPLESNRDTEKIDQCTEQPKEIEEPLPTDTNQIEESIENIEKELKQEPLSQTSTCNEQFVEPMEVDSVKPEIEEPSTSQTNDNNAELGTEDITSPENFDSTENTDQETEPNENSNMNEEPENISEVTQQSTDIVDSGIDGNQTESETCAEISQISETESIPQTIDEVSDLPQDTNSSEITEPENTVNEDANENEDQIQANTECSKKPFRISFSENTDDMEGSAEKEEIEIQTKGEETSESQIAEEEIEDKVEVTKEPTTKNTSTDKIETNIVTKTKISNLLDDWDDGDTDSQQSDTIKQNTAKKDDSNSIKTLINDWEDEED